MFTLKVALSSCNEETSTM